tara:strand:- start:5469 stop:9347 length:3879 start_codon:yes stop_codon:yes gene_type:complete
MGGSYVSAPNKGPLSTSQTPGTIENKNRGITTATNGEPEKFGVTDSTSDYFMAKKQDVELRMGKTVEKPGNHNNKFISPLSSSMRLSMMKNVAVGKSSYNKTPNMMTFKRSFFRDVNSALRKARNGGSNVPAKVSARENPSSQFCPPKRPTYMPVTGDQKPPIIVPEDLKSTSSFGKEYQRRASSRHSAFMADHLKKRMDCNYTQCTGLASNTQNVEDIDTTGCTSDHVKQAAELSTIPCVKNESILMVLQVSQQGTAVGPKRWVFRDYEGANWPAGAISESGLYSGFKILPTKYGFYTGVYKITNIPETHAFTILNKGKEELISIKGSDSKMLKKTVGNFEYPFYYGDVEITVTDDFGHMSAYCYYHGYMGGEDMIVYSEKCSPPVVYPTPYYNATGLNIESDPSYTAVPEAIIPVSTNPYGGTTTPMVGSNAGYLSAKIELKLPDQASVYSPAIQTQTLWIGDTGRNLSYPTFIPGVSLENYGIVSARVFPNLPNGLTLSGAGYVYGQPLGLTPLTQYEISVFTETAFAHTYTIIFQSSSGAPPIPTYETTNFWLLNHRSPNGGLSNANNNLVDKYKLIVPRPINNGGPYGGSNWRIDPVVKDGIKQIRNLGTFATYTRTHNGEEYRMGTLYSKDYGQIILNQQFDDVPDAVNPGYSPYDYIASWDLNIPDFNDPDTWNKNYRFRTRISIDPQQWYISVRDATNRFVRGPNLTFQVVYDMNEKPMAGYGDVGKNGTSLKMVKWFVYHPRKPVANYEIQQGYGLEMREENHEWDIPGFDYTKSVIQESRIDLVRGDKTTIEPKYSHYTGPIEVFSIDPPLPDGLSLDPRTGVISGTPTKNSITILEEYNKNKPHNRWGTDPKFLPRYLISIGSPLSSNRIGRLYGYWTIVLDIFEPEIVFTYGNNDIFKVHAGQQIDLNVESSTGGVIDTFESVSLPEGFELNTSSGRITGVCPYTTQDFTAVILTRTKLSLYGKETYAYKTVTFRIVEKAPRFEMVPSTVTWYKNVDITQLIVNQVPEPRNLNGGGVDKYIVTPPLPSGMNIDEKTGRITGIPRVEMGPTFFTVTGTNTNTSFNALLIIEILQTISREVAPKISYGSNNYTFIIGKHNEAIMINEGGQYDHLEIYPELPEGITIEKSGKIAGTPTKLKESTVYVIAVKNTAKNLQSATSIRLSSILRAPSFNYVVGTQQSDPAVFFLDENTVSIPPATVRVLSGPIHKYEVSPALPVGLTLNETTGEISGNPKAVTANTPYTITATGELNSTSTITLYISVVEKATQLLSKLSIVPDSLF